MYFVHLQLPHHHSIAIILHHGKVYRNAMLIPCCHDENFRAVTSILSIIGRPGEAQYDNTLGSDAFKDFKRMPTAPVLLVRTRACLPNHHLKLDEFSVRTGG
jgi:hypothetical protein